jgi:hypothetical protein
VHPRTCDRNHHHHNTTTNNNSNNDNDDDDDDAGDDKRRYILRDTGDKQFDDWRAIVVSLFEEKEHLKRRDVMQKVQEVTGATLPGAGYKKLMKGIAVTGAKGWILLPGTGAVPDSEPEATS